MSVPENTIYRPTSYSWYWIEKPKRRQLRIGKWVVYTVSSELHKYGVTIFHKDRLLLSAGTFGFNTINDMSDWLLTYLPSQEKRPWFDGMYGAPDDVNWEATTIERYNEENV